MKYLLIAVTMFLMLSCEKENAQRPASEVKYDTTAYFRFTDSLNGYYCFSRLETFYYPGKITVTIKSISDSTDLFTIYNMPQLPSGVFYLTDYRATQYHEFQPFAEAVINGRQLFSSGVGGWIQKTGYYSFNFSFKYDGLAHRITGYGSY